MSRTRPDADGDEAGRGHQAVDEARAGGVEVEGPAGGSERGLDGRRGPGHQGVGGGGGQQQDVDVRGLEARPLQGLSPGFGGQAGGRAADPALADAGPLGDPFVAGVEPGGEVVVGDDLVGHRDAAAPHGHAPGHAHLPAATAWMPT